jgi:hypothetical protein
VPRPRAGEHSQITRVRLRFYLKILHRNSALRQWAAEHVPFKRIAGPNEAAAVLFLASPAWPNRTALSSPPTPTLRRPDSRPRHAAGPGRASLTSRKQPARLTAPGACRRPGTPSRQADVTHREPARSSCRIGCVGVVAVLTCAWWRRRSARGQRQVYRRYIAGRWRSVAWLAGRGRAGLAGAAAHMPPVVRACRPASIGPVGGQWRDHDCGRPGFNDVPSRIRGWQADNGRIGCGRTQLDFMGHDPKRASR